MVGVTDVYDYDGGRFHPRCVIEAMIRRGELSPAARGAATSESLEQFTQANAVTPADIGAAWLPQRSTVTADGDDAERECSGCDRLLAHDVSVPVRPDPIEHATGARPTSREIADLLTDYHRMVADANGWASRVPAEQAAAWEARKHELLGRIQDHPADAGDRPGDRRDNDGRDHGEHGRGLVAVTTPATGRAVAGDAWLLVRRSRCCWW